MKIGLVWFTGIVAAGLGGSPMAADPLPEGNVGIAAGYEGDVGIESDPDVVLFDDFEGYVVATDLDAMWESVFQYDQIRFATEPENVIAGDQALQFTVPQQDAELSNSIIKWVSPELDTLFLRYYTKFDTPYDVTGSSHNGSSISAHYHNGHQATPGIPADGTNKWLANLENWRGDAATPSPGLTNVYIYHPEQRSQWGDHFFPTGLVSPNTSLPFDFGPDFVPRDELIPELDRWYCIEFMVQANTPGERDGRIAAWVDGALVGDWLNLRLRDVPELTIDRFGIGLHIGSNPNGETHKWYDNVVAAHAYIGPIGDGSSGGSSTGGGDEDGEGGSASGGGDAGTTGGGPGQDGPDAPSSGDGAADGNASGEGGGSMDPSGCGCKTDDRPPLWISLALIALIRRRCGSSSDPGARLTWAARRGAAETPAAWPDCRGCRPAGRRPPRP